MYKVRGVKPKESKPYFPNTSQKCFEAVAGKVLQIEMLQEQIDKVKSFDKFFADLYCAAYVNGMVTMKNGL